MVTAVTKTNLGNVFPQAIPGISAWPLFPAMYAVGSQSLDSYVVVPASRLKLVTEIISRLDGRRSLAIIAADYLEQGQSVDLVNLYARLDEAGLLVGSQPRGELQALGIHLFDIPVKRLFAAGQGFFARLFPLLALLTGIALLAGIWLFASAPRHWISLGISHIAVPPVPLYSIAVCGYLGTILWHELCHAIAATRSGLVPGKISVLGYMALIPLFVIRIPGIYLLPPTQRIRIWAAGIWGSLALAGIAMAAVHFFSLPLVWQQSLARLALANLFVGASNLLPFLPTDGYFILSTVFRQANIRRRAFKEFKDWIRFRRSGNVLLLAYVLLSGLAILALLARSVFRMYQLARYSMAGFAAVLALITLLFVRGRMKGRSSQ